MTDKTVAAGLFKPEIWSKELTRHIMDYGVMLDCVNRNWEGEIKNQGDTVHIQEVGGITVNTHSDSTDLTYQTLSGSTQTLVVDQAKNFAFRVMDIEKVQANVEYMTKYLNQAKKEIVNAKDAYLHTLGFAGADTANQVGTVAITKANIYDIMLDLFTRLSRSNAIDSNGRGEDGKRPYIVLPPEIIKIIKGSPEMSHASVAADDVIRKGTIMTYAGFDVKQSTTVKDTKQTSETTLAGKYSILAGTTEGITYAEQITKVESLRDISKFGDFVRGLYLYGAKVVQPKCIATATFTIAA